MSERFRIVIEVRTYRSLALQLFSRSESILYDYVKKGRVELYRVYQFKLEKDIVEKTGLIEARTIG